jgi:AAHS family 4-hydroxybenzoate transporter-like MFS transporter
MDGASSSSASPPAGQPPIDVRQLIDARGVGGFQLGVAVLCGLIVFLDGYDALIMGYVAPALSKQFHIQRSELGPVLSYGLIGMLAGAVVFGPLADRFGRRPVLLVCPIIFGVGSLLAASAGSVNELLVYRLLTGLGMGGAMPNAIALTAEFMPRRARATAVTTMFCGFSLGSAAAGWVAAAMLPEPGWPWVFRLGGILPIAITVVSYLLLPESIRFLVRRRPGDRRAARYLAKIAPDAPVSGELTLSDEESHRRFPIVELFAAGRHVLTPLLWFMFFANLLDLYFVNSWMPTIMKGTGVPEGRAILITTLFQVGGSVGAVIIGRMIDRRLERGMGRNVAFSLLALSYLFAAVFVFLIGESGTSTLWLVVTVFASGLGVIGAQNCANALAAEVYPTVARSTGVGWALGAGRLGAILGPYLGAQLVGQTSRLFLIATVPLVLAALAAFIASGQVRARA